MTETETLCNGKWLRLKRRGRWEYAERTNPGGGVMIVAVLFYGYFSVRLAISYLGMMFS
jgi:hypothetical protein